MGEHQRRPSVALDHTSRRDADDATMPPVAVDHDAMRVAEIGLLFKARLDGLKDAALFFLAVTVELIESTGNLPRPSRFPDAEKLDDIAGHIHPSGGVQARCDAEGNLCG